MTAAATTVKEEFLLAGRRMGVIPIAFSIAAAWIWAPALFVSTQVAYQHGWQGLAWFTVPNVAAILVVGALAQRLRRRLPDGFTFSGYLRDRHGTGVFAIGIAEDIILSVAGFAVQLLAGGLVLSSLTGLPYLAVIAGLAFVTTSYAVTGGFRASVWSDYLYVALIGLALIILVPLALATAGPGSVLAGAAVLPTDPIGLALTWGLPLTIGLLTGPFADQAFWQRAFAAPVEGVNATFRLAAVIFAVVPIGLGLLGLALRGTGLAVDDPQLANLAAVDAFLPAWGGLAFAAVLLVGLCGAMDTHLTAMSSIVAHEFGGTDDRTAIRRGKLSMLALAGGGLVIAVIPGLTILHLQLLYGMLRSAAFIPGVMTIRSEQVSSRGAFVGILAGLAISVPLFVYGQLLGGGALPSVASAVLAVVVSGAICFAWTRYEARA